jgi:antitoxin HicB
VIIAKDRPGYRARFPDFPAGITHGDTRAEAVTWAQDLLETMVSYHIAEGLDLPAPSSSRGRPLVHLPPLSAAKALLYRELRRSGISKAELARRLRWHMPQVMRLLDLRHKSGLDQIESAMRALGKTLVVEARDAA